jgi:uncharacterized protein YydD (DUF2326 family)
MDNNPENPTIDDFASQVKELHRRIQSVNTKMETLNSRSPEVKRFVAYLQVLEEYQKLMEGYLQQTGFMYAIKDSSDD